MFFSPVKTHISRFKLFLFKLLVCKAFYNTDSEEAVLKACVKLAHLDSLALERSLHFLSEKRNGQKHKRQKHENNQRKRNIDTHQNHKRPYDFYRRNEHFLRKMMRKFGYVEKVVCNARHNLPDFRVVKIRKRKLLQMSEQITAHIGFKLCAGYVAYVRHVVIRKRVNNSQKQIPKPDFDYR